MTDRLRLILEIGKERRVVAGATDWPGLDRWGTSEEGAIERLLSYLPRYDHVAEPAGMSSVFVEREQVMDHAWEMEDRDQS